MIAENMRKERVPWNIFLLAQWACRQGMWWKGIITLTRFLRPSMHFGGQPICLSTSTTMVMSALPSCWTSLRSRSLNRRSSLISRGRGEMSASCCSIAEVKLEWKYCSKSRHSRIRQTESILSDKDAKVRELTVSLWSSEEIFLRKFSFLVRHKALADPSPITIDAGVLEYHLGILRSL